MNTVSIGKANNKCRYLSVFLSLSLSLCVYIMMIFTKTNKVSKILTTIMNSCILELQKCVWFNFVFVILRRSILNEYVVCVMSVMLFKKYVTKIYNKTKTQFQRKTLMLNVSHVLYTHLMTYLYVIHIFVLLCFIS